MSEVRRYFVVGTDDQWLISSTEASFTPRFQQATMFKGYAEADTARQKMQRSFEPEPWVENLTVYTVKVTAEPYTNGDMKGVAR